MGLKGMFRSLIIGAAAGAAVVYLNDPEKGRQRRDKLTRQANDALEQVRESDLAAQVQERASELASAAADKADEVRGVAEETVDEMTSDDSTTGSRDRQIDVTEAGSLRTGAPHGQAEPMIPGQAPS
jgi:gas vesicle protein